MMTQLNRKSPLHKQASQALRLTVLHLCPDLAPNDSTRETVDLAILTQRSGWRALIASSGGMLVTEAERTAVRHTRVPLDKQGYFTKWRNGVQLEALLQKERPALLHSHGIETLSYACALSRFHHLPLVVDLTQPLTDTIHTRRLMTQIKHHQHQVRVPSAYMGHHLHQVFGLAAEQIHLVPSGIDLNIYNAGSVSTERLQALSRLWRLPEQASILLVPMPFRPELGHDALLQALARMKNDNIFAVLVGNDHQTTGTSTEIENSVNRYGLNGKIVMPDHCADWAAACWLANVVIAPNTLPRGQNRTVLMAQAMGRPVIVTDSGANTELVRRGETAWVVPTNDVSAMTEALHQTIHLDTKQRLILADNTRGFIAETFPHAGWFNGMMDIYKGMLEPAEMETKVA